ncbi:hypothetical protein ACTFIW_001974 [Dictyostelium discoideum]
MNSLFKRINTIQINTYQISNTFFRNYAKTTPLQKLVEDQEKNFLLTNKNIISVSLFKDFHQALFDSVDQELLVGSKKLPVSRYLVKTSFENREKAAEFFKQAKKFVKKHIEETEEKKKLQREKDKEIEKSENENENDKEKENENENVIENGNEKIIGERKKRYRHLLNPSEVKPSVHALFKSLDPIYKVTPEDLKSLPISNIDTSNAVIIEKASEIENGVKLLLNGKSVDQITLDDGIVLGFDLEWSALERYTTKTKKETKTALITLTNGCETVLFRVCHTGLDENSELGKLLKSGVITKTGFGAGKDSNKILKDFGFEVDGIFDLKYTPKILALFKNRAVEYVTGGLFGVNIKRNSTLILSAWGTSHQLKQRQIHSSALYTIYSLKTYFMLPSLKVDTTFIEKDTFIPFAKIY